MGERVSDTRVVAAPIDAVWEIVVDVAAYPQWAQGVLEAEVLETTDDGWPRRARFRVDARVAEVGYTLAYDYDGYDVRWQLVEGETISQLDGAYELRETPDGTEVAYTLEVDVDLPLPAFLTKRAARTILEQGLDGLRRRAEELT